MVSHHFPPEIPWPKRPNREGLKELSDLVKSYQGLRENEQRGAGRGEVTVGGLMISWSFSDILCLIEV